MELRKNLAKKPKIIIVEDHNDALKHIYRGIGSKKLPYKMHILHFDSHPDLLVPQDFVATKLFDSNYVLETVSIESWLLPPIAAGHFPFITWVCPPWSNQIIPGKYDFLVGEHKETGALRVSCPEMYFVAEQIFAPASQIKQPAKSTELTVVKLKENDPNICTLSVTSPYILDIDMDFYSTLNPFLSMFPNGTFELIEQLYHWNPTHIDPELAMADREKQIKDIKIILDHVKSGGAISELPPSPHCKIIEKLLAKFPPNIDWEMVHLAGTTCDQTPLPHHPSSPEEIDNLLEITKKILTSLEDPPLMITLARSSQDEYCPASIVDSIQAKLLKLLNSIYGPCLDVIEDYDKDLSDNEDSSN